MRDGYYLICRPLGEPSRKIRGVRIQTYSLQRGIGAATCFIKEDDYHEDEIDGDYGYVKLRRVSFDGVRAIIKIKISDRRVPRTYSVPRDCVDFIPSLKDR